MNAILIALSDLRRTLRSLFAIGMMLGAPLLLTALLHFAFGQLGRASERPTPVSAPPRVTLLVADLERSGPRSAALGRRLIESSRQPTVRSWLGVRELGSEAEVRAALVPPASIGLIVPEGFSEALARDPAAPALRLIEPAGADPAAQQAVRTWIEQLLDPVTAARVAAETADAVAREAGASVSAEDRAASERRTAATVAEVVEPAARGSGAWLEVRAPVLSGRVAASEPAAAAAPPVLATVTTGLLIFFMFFTAGHSAQSIPLEAQSGTLARLLVTPTRRAQILLGKFLAVFIVVAVQATLLLSFSSALLGITWGPLPALALVLFGVVAGAGGFGVLLVTLARTPRESSIIVSLVSAAAGMLGGLFTSAMQMPAAFELAGLLVPQGWALRGFKLLQAGAGVPELLAPVAMSCGIGGACLAASVALFQRRFR
jgi:linearmycin/streptolysin S transport system permease protein